MPLPGVSYYRSTITSHSGAIAPPESSSTLAFKAFDYSLMASVHELDAKKTTKTSHPILPNTYQAQLTFGQKGPVVEVNVAKQSNPNFMAFLTRMRKGLKFLLLIISLLTTKFSMQLITITMNLEPWKPYNDQSFTAYYTTTSLQSSIPESYGNVFVEGKQAGLTGQQVDSTPSSNSSSYASRLLEAPNPQNGDIF
jgi:hypothetical protein